MNPNDADTLFTDLENNEAKKADAYPNIKSLLTLFFVSILFMICVAIPTAIISIGIANNNQMIKSLLNLVMYITSLSLIINYAAKKSKKYVGTLKIGFNSIQGWLALVIIIATLALIIPLSQISDWLPMPESVRRIFEQTFTKNVFSIAVAAIAAPILEEILCRGIILNGLLKNYTPRKAILISAIFFAAIHLNPWQALPAFFGGLFMGWLYYKTQSVIPGMIVHATINITATLLMFAPAKQQDFPTLFGPHYYLLAVMVSVMVFVAACLVIQRKILIVSKSYSL